MTPQQFQSKWSKSELKESSAAHSHFNDLCRVLGVATPTEADPKGEWYCFEKGASKVGGGEGWADVWKRGCFGWEYKGKGKSLDAAYAQLQHYAPALESPPLLVVCDLDHIRIHTDWTNTVLKVYDIPLERLAEPENLQTLKWLFSDPEKLKPGVTREQVTQAAASRFAQLAERLRSRDNEPQRVAHFLNRLVFCLFAEDAGLLPGMLFTRALKASRRHPAQSTAVLCQLFAAMQKGGLFGVDLIDWFNGGLFDNDDALELLEADIDDVLDVAKLDWTAMEPSIFGTLFERGLDPSKRSQLGAHYTDAQSIMRIVNPVIVKPLTREWLATKLAIETALTKAATVKSPGAKSKARKDADGLYQGFLLRLANYRVLDPACGSGNFLYLALQSLKDIEHRASIDAEQLGLQRGFVGMNTGVQNVQGIELNSYAAELARVVIWIGEIQWMLKHGVSPSKDPILKPLESIECRDAVLNDDGSEPMWPEVDAIIGNPPFLGDKRMNTELGSSYVKRLRACYADRVSGGADLVCYWFEKARDAIADQRASAAGLVATNSIRGGANRRVLDQIYQTCTIVDAWADEDWVNEGAAVRVSIISFVSASRGGSLPILDGRSVKAIHADLTAEIDGIAAVNLTTARALRENTAIAFSGITKKGGFDITREDAEQMLAATGNPNGRPNSDVVAPWKNGEAITAQAREMYIINFGEMSEVEAAKYQAPFEYVLSRVKPQRMSSNNATERREWWKLARRAPAFFAALGDLGRFIATPEVSKHRVFVWLPRTTVPDKNLVAFARDDEITFGILHSRMHEIWALRLGTSLEDRPRYTSTTTFRTFPFPAGLTVDKPAEVTAQNAAAGAIAGAAIGLNALRNNWLTPPDWIESVTDIVPGWPARTIAKIGSEAELRMRTLTHLYNARPAWLVNAHHELDKAVAVAYGWGDYTPDTSDEEILRRLLVLNQKRA